MVITPLVKVRVPVTVGLTVVKAIPKVLFTVRFTNVVGEEPPMLCDTIPVNNTVPC